MTKLEAIGRIRENLHDEGITYYDIADLDDSLQDAYDEIVVFSQCLEKFVDLTPEFISLMPEGAGPWLNFRDAIPDFYRVTFIINRTTRQFLNPVLDRENDEYQWDWRLNRHNPWDFVINGPEWIGFPGWYKDYPEPLRVFYKATALPL